MLLTLVRNKNEGNCNIGGLFINKGIHRSYFTLEDLDRGLDLSMPLSEINSKKIYGETAIPTGKYKISMTTYSPSFGGKEPYKTLCNGNIPRLLDVPGYEGILIHIGNYAKDTYGCILVGMGYADNMITDSKTAFADLYKKMKAAHDKGEEIWIEIT